MDVCWGHEYEDKGRNDFLIISIDLRFSEHVCGRDMFL